MKEIENLWKRALNESWNPLDINFDEDVKDWKVLSEIQRKYLTDLFYYQIFGEYEVLIGVSRLAKLIKDKDARFFLLTHARDNTVHANVFERFLLTVGEDPKVKRERISDSYFDLIYLKPRKLLEELEKEWDVNKLASFLTLYYFAADGILYNVSYLSLEQILFSRNILKKLHEAYKKINVDEKRQTMFAAYYIKYLSERNKEIVETVKNTLNEATPLILSVIGYFAPLAESFGRQIEEFASLIEGVIDEELKIIGLK
jgi:ribonucleotide reductase beta subunit family protein with ferritin-like domain